MDCNLTDIERSEGTRCRSFSCNPCRDFIVRKNSMGETYLIEVNKGSGATGHWLSHHHGDYVHDSRDVTTRYEKAIKFFDKESAEAMFRLMGFTKKDWMITDHLEG